MKTIVVAGMALLAAGAAGAKQWNDLSSEEQAGFDSYNWGEHGESSLGNLDAKIQERHAELIAPLEKLNGSLNTMIEDITGGYAADYLRDDAAALCAVAVANLCPSGPRMTAKDVGDQSASASNAQGINRVNYLREQLARLEGSSKRKLEAMIQEVRAQDLFCRNYRAAHAVHRLEDMDLPKAFESFARAYNEAMHHLDMAAKRGGAIFTFSELLIASKLDGFVNDNGQLKSSLAAQLHVADRYLEAIDYEKIDELDESVKKVKARAYDAWMVLGSDFDLYQETAITVHPDDRKRIQKYFDLWNRYLDLQDKLLVKKSEEIVTKCRDASTPIGKLRYMEGEAWFRLLNQEGGGAGGNGKPRYEKRMKELLEKLWQRHAKLRVNGS